MEALPCQLAFGLRNYSPVRGSLFPGPRHTRAMECDALRRSSQGATSHEQGGRGGPGGGPLLWAFPRIRLQGNRGSATIATGNPQTLTIYIPASTSSQPLFPSPHRSRAGSFRTGSPWLTFLSRETGNAPLPPWPPGNKMQAGGGGEVRHAGLSLPVKTLLFFCPGVSLGCHVVRPSWDPQLGRSLGADGGSFEPGACWVVFC